LIETSQHHNEQRILHASKVALVIYGTYGYIVKIRPLIAVFSKKQVRAPKTVYRSIVRNLGL
jgi:hypothetical protein